MSKDKVKHSGFVGIIGQPNVGKSTLLNQLVGEKLAGVSARPQTTREIIRGILSEPEGQAVFLDTPGLHKPTDAIGSWMVNEVEKTLTDVDLLYFMVRPKPAQPFERKIVEMIKESGVPCFLLVNQVDRFKKQDILPVLDEYQNLHNFAEFIPISALTGLQVNIVVEKTFEYLPECPPLFPEDQISDQNERFIAAELIREKLYHFTHEEVPYSTLVFIDRFEERNEKLIDIEATIIVERDSQKAIVIGKKGQNLKDIGQAAREDLEKFLGRKVFLQLWAKTMPDWKSDKRKLKKFGFR